MKRNRLLPLLAAFGLAQASPSFGEDVAPIGCAAAVSAAGDIYAVGRDTPPIRFTRDGESKLSVDLSPDAQRIVYLSANESDFVFVADDHGNIQRYDIAALESRQKGSGSDGEWGPLIGVEWSTNDSVRLQHHMGKEVSRFFFAALNGSRKSESDVAFLTGADCQVANASNHTACLEGGVRILVDGATVYQEPLSSFSDKRGELVLAQGDAVPISGFDGWSLQLVGFKDDTVGLKIVTSTRGYEPEFWINVGSFAPIGREDGGVLFFEPLSIDAGRVTVGVFTSRANSHSDIAALAWSPTDNALVARMGGELLWLSPTQHPAILTMRTPNPLDGSVKGMKFISGEELYIHGEPNSWRVRAAKGDWSKPIVESLPVSLAIEGLDPAVSTRVVSWSCRSVL